MACSLEMYIHTGAGLSASLLKKTAIKCEAHQHWPFRVCGATSDRFEDGDLVEDESHQIHQAHAEWCEHIKQLAHKVTSCKTVCHYTNSMSLHKQYVITQTACHYTDRPLAETLWCCHTRQPLVKQLVCYCTNRPIAEPLRCWPTKWPST